MEEKQVNLCESEYRLAEIVWEREPVSSGELVALCEGRLGWKKSTVYTVLKKLCQKGVLQNENATVIALVKAEQVQRFDSEQLVNGRFGGSLPRFLTAFMAGKKISPTEAEELKQLIDSYREKED